MHPDENFSLIEGKRESFVPLSDYNGQRRCRSRNGIFYKHKKDTQLFSRIRNFLLQRRAAQHKVILRGIDFVSNGAHVLFEETAKLRHVLVELPDMGAPMTMGAHSYMRSGSRILNVSSIGRYCSIGRNVTLGEAPRNHPVEWVSTSLSVSHRYKESRIYTEVGNDVWIGNGAVVMAGVKVGHGAIIALNAVVTKDVEPYQIVGGNPSRLIRYRFNESTRAALLASQWWELDHAALQQLPFDDIDAFLSKVGGITTKAQYKQVALRGRRIIT
jgi:acetyltransferase-like isoleucine patch superfamily enzyme